MEDLNGNTKGSVLSVAPASPTQDPAATITTHKSPKKYRKPAYLNTMSEAEKDANLKVIENMNKRLNYLKNPRHKTEKPPILLSNVFFAAILQIYKDHLRRHQVEQ